MNTKTRILDTAEFLFAEKGYSSTGIGEIAARVGIVRSVIYHHFSGKEDILHSLLRRFSSFSADLSLPAGIDSLLDILESETVRRLSRILMMETLRGKEVEVLFPLWEEVLKNIFRAAGLEPSFLSDGGALFPESFFFEILPLFGYAALRTPLNQSCLSRAADLRYRVNFRLSQLFLTIKE